MPEKVVLKLDLVRPYNKSVYTLYDLVNIWGFDLLSSGTNKQEATIRIPVKDFRKIFGKEPKIGKWSPPSGTTQFIENVNVIKIEDIPHAKSKRSKPNKVGLRKERNK